MGQRENPKTLKVSRHRFSSEMPLKWRFAGKEGPHNHHETPRKVSKRAKIRN